MTLKNLIYLLAILTITLDLFVWRPDYEPEQLRPEHRRGVGELKAMAIARSDEAYRQRHLGHPSLRHSRAHRQAEQDCNDHQPALTRSQYRACVQSHRLERNGA